MKLACTWCTTLRTLLRDVARGLFIITHSGLAMVGLGATTLLLAFWLNPQGMHSAETATLNWLRERGW